MLAANHLGGFVLYALVTSRPLLRIIVNRSLALDGSRVGADELCYRFAAAHQFHAQHAVLAFLTGKLELEVVHRLPCLARPVQLIWGERAALALPRLLASSAQIQVDTISGSNLFPHEEQPERVVACVRAHDAKEQQSLQPVSAATAVELQPDVTDKTAAGMEPVEHVEVEERREQEITGTDVETVVSATDSTALAGQVTGEEAVAEQEGLTAYCFKCKQKRTIQNAQKITTPKGRRAMEGTCPICGTRLFRFVAG
jgi:predicted  nucleic acid-binding Zn-ribbon protein